jgi:hypothetical protein
MGIFGDRLLIHLNIYMASLSPLGLQADGLPCDAKTLLILQFCSKYILFLQQQQPDTALGISKSIVIKRSKFNINTFD